LVVLSLISSFSAIFITSYTTAYINASDVYYLLISLLTVDTGNVTKIRIHFTSCHSCAKKSVYTVYGGETECYSDTADSAAWEQGAEGPVK